MKKSIVIFVAILCCSMAVKAQMKRSDDFRARYELKEVVVMSRLNYCFFLKCQIKLD